MSHEHVEHTAESSRVVLSSSSSISEPSTSLPSAPATLYPTIDAPSESSHVTTLSAPHDAFDDSPPSYEAVITKDITQLHDNYDHLRGPPGQRGQDMKARIPAESLSASHYQSAGAGSSNGNRGPSEGYGSTSAGTSGGHPGIVHSSTSAHAPNLGLQGQIALDDDADYARDVDRLLGADHESIGESSTEGDDPPDDDSSWAVVGDGHAWMILCYLIFVLLPWSIFCYAWTFCFMLVSLAAMIVPPLGYLFTIASVASWRAFARVDLVLSSALVSHEIRQRYPHTKAQVYLAAEPGPAWTAPHLFGRELPLPEFVRRRLQSRQTARGRRVKNLWHRGAKHLRTTVTDRHTIRSMFYFLIWKMMYAIPIFFVVVVYFCLTVPFMICLLPSLLSMSKVFANWQYRWAVTWLSEKPAPIVL
ncbi:hypothetical protein BGZ70_006629 [Mortierella alpina]|uniref:Transmembrane protein n=1 Tax=Mortierella alpina TaxID=64518 RepID=A0A9P6JB00_MORAP|nr:hypothetical protein BGZ70_006629 [Mortierella alpina]